MRPSKGFTLLEVMVALTITAMALGALFSVIAGNKRLAFSAEAALIRTMQLRSLINLAQLGDDADPLYLSEDHDEFVLANGTELEAPERKTEGTLNDLRGFHITNDEGETLAQGTYWVQQELPTGGVIGTEAATDQTANPFTQAAELPAQPLQQAVPQR